MRKVLYILGQLTDRDIEWLAKSGSRRQLRTGDVLIEEGQPIDFISILLDGQLSVSISGLGMVAELGVGEIVGEMSFVDTAPPSATVTALGDCLTFVIDRRELARHLDSDTAFGLRFYRALGIFMADRLRDTVRRLGYGEASLASKTIVADELDETILDTVSLAGERFDRLIKTLTGARNL
jgi:CRP-like cAMP-binding protein